LTDYPDGLAVDIGGNLYVAEAVAGSNPGGRVQVFSATGQKLGEIPFASTRPTGVAFGGAQNAQLFITVENGVYVFSGRCAGIP
jgi:sugar lactone lactonase YvrE